MDTSTLLIIIIVVLIVLGGGWTGRSYASQHLASPWGYGRRTRDFPGGLPGDVSMTLKWG